MPTCTRKVTTAVTTTLEDIKSYIRETMTRDNQKVRGNRVSNTLVGKSYKTTHSLNYQFLESGRNTTQDSTLCISYYIVILYQVGIVK